jgi:hypothetical protein
MKFTLAANFIKLFFTARDVNYPAKRFIKLAPGTNIIKLFTVVFYPHLMVLQPSCVIKHNYCCKYHRMPVNSLDKKF